MDKTKELGTKSVGQLLAQYSIPAVVAMLVNAIYNIIDRIFIGKIVGESALGGLTIAFPVMMILFAFVSLVGAGGAAVMSIRLGEKDMEGTNKAFGNMLGAGVIITLLTVVTIYVNLESILVLYGATPDVLGYAFDYMRIILLGFVFQMTSFNLSGAVRTEGQPVLSMLAMIVSAVTNIILDYIFIALLGWGVEGAALATILGQLTGLILLLGYYVRGKSVLKLNVKDFIPKWSVYATIFSIGFATFITTVGTSISMSVLNKGLIEYGGTAAITSMGAINSLYTLFIMPIMGIQQGMQPIIGYNHGAKQHDRVFRTLKLGIYVGVGFSTVVFALMELFPKTFITMFVDPASATIQTAVVGLRIFMIMLPLLCINLYGIAFYQSTAHATKALVLGLLRQIAFLIPSVLIMQNIFGLVGVWASVPLSDGLAIVVTGVALLMSYKKSRNDAGENTTEIQNVVELQV